MRAVIQRVKEAGVTVDGNTIGKINEGILVFLGIGTGDNEEDARYLVDNIVNLRIFADKEGKMNLSALDLGREILIVSQFTLYGDCRRGRRPNFTAAASPGRARELYRYFVNEARQTGLKIETGEFKAMMDVELINDGPVTLLLDSKREF
ncbi:MAG: D-aminoacyl-tRNA deacylase [Halanaerobiales bacterium]